MTTRYFNPRNWSAAGLNLEQIEYLRNLDTDTDKALVSFKFSPAVFSYDGTDYQTQRNTAVYYTYNTGGTYQYQNGSTAVDANREFPWLDTEVEFYRGDQLRRTFVFRHLCNYGIESAGPGRIGTKVRSYLRSWTGTEREANFTVQIGSTTCTVWDGTLYGGTHDVVTSYGGSSSDYLITITHTPTGKQGIVPVTLTATGPVAPFYDGSGGGGYK
jgi:hypothetical protein